MLKALCAEGLLQPTDDPPNAQVFLKCKSAEKAAMIVNMQHFNAVHVRLENFASPQLRLLLTYYANTLETYGQQK